MNFMKRVKIVFLCCVLCVLLWNPAWATTLLSFNPSSSSINVGDSIDVEIRISGFENGVDLGAFDFNLNFDDTILDFTGYTLGTGLNNNDIDQSLDMSTGFNLSELSFLDDFSFQEDEFVLATVSFVGKSIGTSTLSLSDIVLSSAFPLNGVDENPIMEISADTDGGSITVIGNSFSAVPEPGTLYLVLMGIIGGLASRRYGSQS
jgi:hypothetical protein